MSRLLIHDPIYDILIFQAILIAIVLSNTRTMRRALRHPAPARFPRVSILVPARNEERNVERCIRSLLAQDYSDFEVLALDDESTDRTRAILEALAGCDARLKVLAGRPLEAGWSGKNWACAQLAAQAAGDLLFFTDADTFHRPGAVRAVVTAMEGERADLMSGFPRQEVLTWGEKLLVPFFSW
ncbi:MAG: glycosyltransferase, partial [Anaerolineae bacterium]|nr:glycosyltransferase [Anaerolineae bacterium]